MTVKFMDVLVAEGHPAECAAYAYALMEFLLLKMERDNKMQAKADVAELLKKMSLEDLIKRECEDEE